MKTTVEIPDHLYGQARELAAARGQKVATLITEGLEKVLVAHRSCPKPNAAKNGRIRQTTLPPKAARWLAEWRTLGHQHRSKDAREPCAAEAVSRMRR